MSDDSFLKWSMSERPRRLKRWAHFVRCEIPLHKDEQEFLGDGTDLASELEEAAEALKRHREALREIVRVVGGEETYHAVVRIEKIARAALEDE